MLRATLAHVRSSQPLADGRLHAVSMFNHGRQGVLVWAGQLEPPAQSKSAHELDAGDFHMRTTISFMSWRDVGTYFEGSPYEPLIAELVSSHKRNESAAGESPSP